MLAAAMTFMFSAVHAQHKVDILSSDSIVVAIGDTITLNAPESTSYEWSSSINCSGFRKIEPAEKERTLKLRAFGENYYRVKYKNESDKTVYDTIKVVLASAKYRKTFDITAGQGYVEVNGKGDSGISIPQEKSDVYGDGDTLRVTQKLTNWTNAKAHAVYFFNTPSGAVNLNMNVTARSGSTVSLRMKIYDTDTPDSLIAENIITFKGTGSEQVIPVITCKFGKKGYNKYDLQCIYGNNNITSINKWIIKQEKTPRSFSPTILMSPSLHIMSWRSTDPAAPKGDAYDWAYEEVMIPGGDSIVNARYIMSLGILNGYMGIQVGEGGAHRTVLFSQWDAGDTDVDPNLPDHLRSTAVDTGEGVIAKRFGAEGTGVQSFRNNGAFWDFGKYVQFISHCRDEISTYETEENGKIVTKNQRNMLVSAWWNAQDGKGWQYISTLRVAKREAFIDSWYSFVECFVNYNGQEKCYGYFRNGYAKERENENKENEKKWYHMNKADFGHNNGGEALGKRNDIWQDVDPNDKYAWIMASGGFQNNMHIGKCEVPLREENHPVDTIDTDALLAREDLAIAKEIARLDSLANFEKYKYDNTKWEMLSFSSEEPTGELVKGDNFGFAKSILDGDPKTYWHSQWQSRTAQLPHSFVIDCKETIKLNAFYFILSNDDRSGDSRLQKDILIEGSLDNNTWYDIYENKNCPNTTEYTLSLDSTAQARYLRLTIRGTQTGVVYTRINEFSAMYFPNATSIEENIETEKIKIYTAGSNIYIDSPEALENAKVDVYSTSGSLVVSHNYNDIKENDLISIHSFKFASGIYTVRVETNKGKVYTAKVMIK